MAHKSDSSIQRKSERVIIKKLEEQLGLKEGSLKTERIQLNNRVAVEIDGYNEEIGVIVEVFSRIGKLKAAHYEKIANDILKLVMVEKIHNKTYRKILAVCDDAVENYMLGYSWKAYAISVFEFEVFNIHIETELRQEILTAQSLQSIGMKE